MTTSNDIPNGTAVQLSDGSTALAYFDRRDGTYRTAQTNPITGETRIDTGWRREQLARPITANTAAQFAAAKSSLARLVIVQGQILALMQTGPLTAARMVDIVAGRYTEREVVAALQMLEVAGLIVSRNDTNAWVLA